MSRAEAEIVSTRKRRSWGVVSLLLVALLVIAGCGSSDDPTTSAATDADATVDATVSEDGALPDSETIKAIQDRGTLRVGGAIALPWLGQDPDTKEYFGPATLIAEKTAEELGVEVEWVPETFDTIVASLQADKIDIANAALYQTPEREAVIEMVPWSLGGFCYLTQADNPLSTTDEFNSPDVTMANFIGTGTFEAVQAAYPEAKQITRTAAAGEGANVPEIQSGKADITPFDASLAKVYEAKYPDLKIIPEDCFESPDLPTPVAVGLPKGDMGFVELVTGIVEEIQPELDEGFAEYAKPEYSGA